MVPAWLWFITIHKLLQMIYKCGLTAWNAFFTVTQRAQWGHVKYIEEQGERQGKNTVCQGDSLKTKMGSTYWGYCVKEMMELLWKGRGERDQDDSMQCSNDWCVFIRMCRDHITKVSALSSLCSDSHRSILLTKSLLCVFSLCYHSTRSICPLCFHRATF